MTNENKTASEGQLDKDAMTNQGYTATPSIPDEKAAPKPEPVRDYLELPKNIAEDSTIAATVLDKVKEYFTKFRDQAARTQLETDMKSADRMLRVSKTRDRTSATDQQEDTLSNVSSTSYYKAIRIITAGQKAIMFYGDELPVKYEENPGSTDFKNNEEAKRVTREQNLLLRYTFDQDGLEYKLKNTLYFINKYGQVPVGIEWDYETEEKVERVPIEYDEEGRPLTFAFENKRRVVRDWPTLSTYDLKDFYFDTQISDMQDQKCVLFRTQKGIEYLHNKQTDGEYLNVGQVTDDQMFKDEDANNSDVLRNREEDSGQTPESNETGNIEIFSGYIRLPIDDKNKWNPKETVPSWFQFVFAGNIENNAVCLQLRRNPFHHGKLPFKIIYSHLDDKGAVRMGYASLLECLYEEETSTINEMIDNKTLRTRKPWIAEKGNVLSRNLKFRQGNQTIWVKSGTGTTALKEVQVQDTTQNTLLHLNDIRKDFNETAGTDKAMAGQFAGARTTSTEYQGVMNQAMKPALEDAEFMADQILPWIADMSALLWRQFGDPTRIIQVTESGLTYPVKPTELYGDFRTRVVSIGQFEGDMLRRQEENNFIAAAYQFVAPLMGKAGQLEFWRDIMRHRKMENAEKYFPLNASRDAERLAWYENILIFEKGQEVLPQPSDDHDVHLPIIKSQLENYKLLPPDEMNPDSVRMAQLHILLHEQYKEQEAQAMQSMQQGGMPGQGEQQSTAQPPQSTGEVAGETMAGIGGAPPA